MKRVNDNYNILSKNKIFVFIKSLFTSPIFITIYCILAVTMTMFLIYKGFVIWFWINTMLIEQGYLLKLPNAHSMDELAARWCILQIFGILLLSLLIIGICYLIYFT